jgi:ribA/ribD-fused uncharacterized protein
VTEADFTGTRRFLSNFYEAPVTLLGMTWPSAEHAYQASKSLDMSYRLQVQAAPTPGKAKQMGRGAKLRDGWDVTRVPVMLSVLMAKFSQDDDLLGKLIGTGDEPLREGNYWHDNFWGDCYCMMPGESGPGRPSCIKEGKNVLGQLLMVTRSALG